MQLDDPYNEEVRRRFFAPAHAGAPDESHAAQALIVEASARESAHGARLSLSLATNNGVVTGCWHATWGCPHLIAAAELACEQLESAPVGALADFQTNEIMRRLSVPVQKTGRILLVEDAVQSLAAKLKAK